MPTEMLFETRIVLKNIRTCGSMTNGPAFPKWGLEFDFQTHPTARTQVSDPFLSLRAARTGIAVLRN